MPLPSFDELIDSAQPGYHRLLHLRADKKRFQDIIADGMHWIHKKLPGAGGNEFVVDSLALAESTPIGPGVRQRSFWKTIEQPLIYPSQMSAVSGYSGVIQGQFLSQPLYDPYNGVYGNINSQY